MLSLSDPENPEAVEYLTSEDNLGAIRVSPDGTLAAYTSDETGIPEIYLRSFPEPSGPVRVSRGGGRMPFWSPDGNTVYYWIFGGGPGEESTFMEAHIERNPTPVVLSTDSLFTGNYVPPVSDLHPAGDRLIVAQVAGADGADAEPERFIVVVNWFEELRERLGSN